VHCLILLAPLLVPTYAPDDPPLPGPDQVQLAGKDKPLEGRILLVDDQRVVLRKKSRVEEIPRDEVQSYTWVDESLSSLLPAVLEASSGASSAADLADLAATLEAANLPGEAGLVRWMAVAQQKDTEATHDALGHRKEGDHWRVRVGSRWIKDDKLDEHCSDWGNAHELSSAHFDVRSNLPLAVVLRIALDAEYFYDAFFRLFGKDLALYHPSERIGLHMHGAKESFPHGDGLTSFYDSLERLTEINASGGYRADILASELTRHLLDASGRELGDRAAVPGWLWEGIGLLFEATLGLDDPKVERIVFDPARRHERMRAVHRVAEDPHDLGRVLQFGWGDFNGKDGATCSAESYTLVEFLLYGDEGAHRDGFRAFVMGALQGKGSSTDLKKAIGLKEAELEERWLSHVGRK